MPSASQPPASTIIADRIVAANGENSEQLQRERFLQLLEVSTSLDENGQPNIGTDVASNQTLILIIFKAGLDLFADSNPFGAVDSDLAPSVRQSLQVVRLALKRSPEVLLQPIGSNTLLEDLQDVPLFIWLLPKLLSLIESLHLHADSETVSEIRETLTLIVELEGKCSRSARYFTSISAFFQNIINGTPSVSSSAISETDSLLQKCSHCSRNANHRQSLLRKSLCPTKMAFSRISSRTLVSQQL